MNIHRQNFQDKHITSLPAVTAVEIRDPTAADMGIEVITRDLMQLDTKPLRAKRIGIRFGDGNVMLQSTNLRVRTRTTLLGGLLAYVVFGPRARGSVNGLPVRPNLMLAAESGIQVEFVAEEDTKVYRPVSSGSACVPFYLPAARR